MACSCQSKIGKTMKTKAISGALMSAALNGAGFIAADYLGGMAAEQFPTVDSKLLNGGKIVLGAVVLPMLAKGKMGNYLQSIGIGMAVNGIAGLYTEFMGPVAAPAVAGYDNRGYAMSGSDNRGYALGASQSSFTRGSVPMSAAV